MYLRIILSIFCAMILVSCASIKSSVVTDNDEGGLNYYLPKRDLIITVTVSDPVIDELSASRDAYVAQAKFLELKAVSELNPLEKKKLVLAAIEMRALAGQKQTVIDGHTVIPRVTKAESSVSEVYPDTSKQFSINYSKNSVGKNKLDVSVSDNGLLSSANSKTESKLSQVLSNVASSVGSLSAAFVNRVGSPETHNKPCNMPGKYIFNLSFDEKLDKKPICNNEITITLKDYANEIINVNGPVPDLPEHAYSGLFYRQNVPYVVSLIYTNLETETETETLLFSPNTAATHFLPIRKTLFANNEATFTFVDGIPTKYIQESDGEVVAMLKIPADVIAAYFAAVGNVFTSFSNNDKAEISALNNSVQLELAKQKNETCLAAIGRGDTDIIASLKCAN